MPVVQQLLLMVAEGLLIGGLLLASFRLRRWFGPSLVYILFGGIFQFAALLAATVYLQLGSWLVVSPGSVVLFPAVLFLVLLVYVSSDALEARKLIYGVAGANLGLVLLQLLIAQHLTSAIVINPYDLAPQVFTLQPRIVTSSAIVLFLDTILVCLLYDIVSRYTPSIFLRLFLSLTATLYFDSLAFVTGAFAGNPGYVHILLSQLAGKTVAALVYSIMLAVYLEYFSGTERVAGTDAAAAGTMFRIFTYRQRFEALQKIVVRDALTNVYNRGFFDDAIEKYVDMARHSGRPICMMMVDVDNFKAVNDAFGHTAGDDILRLVANALVSGLRVSDYVCRYGGDEFAILLPQTDLAQAIVLAERLVAHVPASCASAAGAGTPPITITIGVAEYPADVADATELAREADVRLYAGKKAGRNRVSADR